YGVAATTQAQAMAHAVAASPGDVRGWGPYEPQPLLRLRTRRLYSCLKNTVVGSAVQPRDEYKAWAGAWNASPPVPIVTTSTPHSRMSANACSHSAVPSPHRRCCCATARTSI